MTKKKPQPTPYADGAKAYRGRGLGQAIPVHPTENNQPAKGLIGFDAPLEGDAPREREKQWRTLADMLPDGKEEVNGREVDEFLNRPPILAAELLSERGGLDTDRFGDRSLGLPGAPDEHVRALSHACIRFPGRPAASGGCSC